MHNFGCDGKYCIAALVLCIIATGSHHAIIGPRRGYQLRRLHVLRRRLSRQKLANALACAAALPKLLFMLYREPRGVWSFKRQVTINDVCAYMLLHLCTYINAGLVTGGITLSCILLHLMTGWRISE